MGKGEDRRVRISGSIFWVVGLLAALKPILEEALLGLASVHEIRTQRSVHSCSLL